MCWVTMTCPRWLPKLLRRVNVTTDVVKAIVSLQTAKSGMRYISPGPPRRLATGRFIIISAFMPISARRWQISCRGRLPCWKSANALNSARAGGGDAHRCGLRGYSACRGRCPGCELRIDFCGGTVAQEADDGQNCISGQRGSNSHCLPKLFSDMDVMASATLGRHSPRCATGRRHAMIRSKIPWQGAWRISTVFAPAPA